jgi:hypothetical protein
MFKRASLRGERGPKRWQSFLPAAKRPPASAQPAAGKRELDGERLYQAMAYVHRTQLSELALGEVPPLQSSDGLFGLHALFGNQTLQSTLARGQSTAKRTERACACGGSCAECSHETEASPENSLVQRFLHEITGINVNRRPLQGQQEEDELLVRPMPLHSDCGPSCSFQDWMKPHRSGQSDELVHQGAATVVCDGAGDYRVDMGGWATAKCGLPDCIRRHEESHATDLRARYPDGCKNADGTPKPAGTPHPTTGDDYGAWLKQTECKAYSVEIPCEEELLRNASAECKPVIQPVLDDSKSQKRSYCGGC